MALELITIDELDKMVLRTKAVDFYPSLNAAMQKFQIITNPRIRHFLAQIMHESGGLNYTTELATGAAYDGRKDLGNTVPGDGPKYKGRGLIQITGKANYAKLSQYFGVDFVANPLLLATPQWAALSAAWFWNEKNLNKWADLDDSWRGDPFGKGRKLTQFEIITRYINGGTNGIEDRLKYLNILKQIKP